MRRIRFNYQQITPTNELSCDSFQIQANQPRHLVQERERESNLERVRVRERGEDNTFEIALTELISRHLDK